MNSPASRVIDLLTVAIPVILPAEARTLPFSMDNSRLLEMATRCVYSARHTQGPGPVPANGRFAYTTQSVFQTGAR